MNLKRVSNLSGRVVAGDYGKGTKSERPAVFLEMSEGKERLQLRRKGGPSYRDQEVEKLVGKRIVCSGFVTGKTLLAESMEVVEDS